MIQATESVLSGQYQESVVTTCVTDDRSDSTLQYVTCKKRMHQVSKCTYHSTQLCIFRLSPDNRVSHQMVDNSCRVSPVVENNGDPGYRRAVSHPQTRAASSQVRPQISCPESLMVPRHRPPPISKQRTPPPIPARRRPPQGPPV